MARSRLTGIARSKRLLRAMPDAVRGQLVVALNLGGRALAAAMKAKAPRKTGAVIAGITYKVLPKTLRLRVGLLGTKAQRRDLFYGRIQDLGRKGKTVLVQRRRRVGFTVNGRKLNALRTRHGKKRAEDIVATYRMNVRPMAPKKFITGRFPELRARIRADLQGIWKRALGSISLGGKGD